MTNTSELSHPFAAGFLHQCVIRLEGYKQMADKAIGQLTAAQLFNAPPDSTGSNSIAVIMQHMAGNMQSRWTNFLTEDGEKPWRSRDREFESGLRDAAVLMADWEAGWTCLLGTLKSLVPEDLEKQIQIRGERLAAYDAILRQLLHYSSHVGQIVYLAKWLKGADWQPLTIAKGQSEDYNRSMGFKA